MNFNPEGGVASNSTVPFIVKELIFGEINSFFWVDNSMFCIRYDIDK